MQLASGSCLQSFCRDHFTKIKTYHRVIYDTWNCSRIAQRTKINSSFILIYVYRNVKWIKFKYNLRGGRNFGPRNFRPGLSSRDEFPVIFRPGPKFRYDFRPWAKNSPEIRTELKRIHHIDYYKKRSAEQYVFQSIYFN